MATYETLILEQKGPLLVISLNRPKALNALNRQLLLELDDALQAAWEQAETAAVILTGSGQKAFAAGADIGEIATLEYEDALAFSANGQKVFHRIENFPKPVLAAVNGFALGGGCELAMACHLRLASENAQFGQPEVKLGLIAGYGGTQRLPRLIGRTKATELLLAGDPIDAHEAHRLGLVSRVLPQDQLLPAAEELLTKVVANSPLALAHTLDAINAGYDEARSGYQVEAVNFAKSAGSQDGHEGTTAFLEKRKPTFTGN